MVTQAHPMARAQNSTVGSYKEAGPVR
jgi:hypothetical protein